MSQRPSVHPAAAPRILFALLLPAVVLGACRFDAPRPSASSDVTFRQDGTLDLLRPDGTVIATLAIEIAEGDSARARGLMERRSLPARAGMLFLSEAPREQSFWMKNTPIPLDIIFIGADSQIVNIARRARPLSQAAITSDGPAQYVLEIRGGLADRLGLDEQTRVRWTIQKPAASTR